MPARSAIPLLRARSRARPRPARALMGCAGFVTLTSAPAAAHHAHTMIDHGREVELTGTVVEFRYVNPHSWLIIAVEGEGGAITHWGFEAEAPGALMRYGVDRTTFSPGSEVTVRGHPRSDGRPAAVWLGATMPDGTEIRPTGRQLSGDPGSDTKLE